MDIERERGITIKSQAVRSPIPPTMARASSTLLTPRATSASPEVSRSLAACEGAVLVVDATGR